MVERLFLAVPWGCLRFVIVVFPDYTHLLILSPPAIFTDRLKVVVLLWIFFVICVSRLYLLFCIVCSLQPCGNLLEKDRPLGSLVCDLSLCFVSLTLGVSDKMWYLIALIPDICLLLYLYFHKQRTTHKSIGRYRSL